MLVHMLTLAPGCWPAAVPGLAAVAKGMQSGHPAAMKAAVETMVEMARSTP
jgi:hypothetical protein